jgi:hypothetical protein
MLLNLSLALFRTVMVWMVAISLLASGFAHRPMLDMPASSAQAMELAEMGLTLADICAEPGGDDGSMAMGDCPACHLSASILLADPVASLVDIELRTAAAILVPAETRGFGRTTNPATPVRAPPLA